MANKFQLTRNEFLIAALFAIAGFIVTTKFVISFMNGLTALGGLLAYYLLWFLLYWVIAKLGFKVFNIQIKTFLQILGMLLITFSFFIIVNWENPYVQLMTKGNIDGASTMFYQSEDGATFMFWNQMLGLSNPLLLRILTFVVTPFIFTLIGALLIQQKEVFI